MILVSLMDRSLWSCRVAPVLVKRTGWDSFSPTHLYRGGAGKAGGPNPAASTWGILGLLWFPSPVIYQTRRVPLRSKGLVNLTQAEVRRGVS